MKRISYAGESVLTSNEVATALIELTAALTTRGIAEAIEIPIVDEHPEQGRDADSAELVVGHGTLILAVREGGHGAEPDYSAAVEELIRRMRQVDPVRSVAIPSKNSELEQPFDEFELGLGEPTADPLT